MREERELLRRALVAWDRPASDKFSVIFEDIRTFLAAEPEADPVAWGQPDACGNIAEKREWQGLTDKEIEVITGDYCAFGHMAYRIEQALKEKNS